MNLLEILQSAHESQAQEIAKRTFIIEYVLNRAKTIDDKMGGVGCVKQAKLAWNEINSD